MEIYNGKSEPTLRHYDSLKNYVGENKVYKYGDVLFVSTQNNEHYDLFLTADGVSDFRTLVKKASEQSGNRIVVTEEPEGVLRVKILDE